MEIDLFTYQSLSLKIELLREEHALLDWLSDYWMLSRDSHNVWNTVWKQIYIEEMQVGMGEGWMPQHVLIIWQEESNDSYSKDEEKPHFQEKLKGKA